MTQKVPLGLSDFRSVREGGFLYVDKSGLIAEVLGDSAQVLLLPRPRRFGKTLNLSMLRCFLDRASEDAESLFAGLAINRDSACAAHRQRHPVIFLTFKDVKVGSWPDCRDAVARVIAAAYREHRQLLDEGRLAPDEAAAFLALMEARAATADLTTALLDLSRILERTWGEKVVILIDEYDTPIHAGYAAGYYEQVVELFRNLLSGGLKDNPHLFKGVLTGILRVAKENLFSGVNNLVVHSLLSPRTASAFGFTEEEVVGILAAQQQSERLEELSRWYNGYRFGDAVIYNPWSVLNCVAYPEQGFRPYWVSTSSNDILRQLLIDQGMGLSGELERLLAGESVERAIDDSVALREVSEQPELVWSFLLFSGYLKVTALRREGGQLFGSLALPNLEVRSTYETLFRSWTQRALGGAHKLDALHRAILDGDAATFERLLEGWLLASASFLDPSGDDPERFYHGFILGLLVTMAPNHEVTSNRESGYGRCDILIAPRAPGLPGVAIELKATDVRRGETMEQALERAMRQIAERDYSASLRARGARPIHELAAAFEGKRIMATSRTI